MKRKISLIMLFAMLMSLTVSCAGDTDDTPESSSNVTTNAEENIPENERLDLPKELDFGGKTFNVLSYEAYASPSNEETASAIQRSMHMQIANTEDRLGIEYEIIKAEPHTNISSMVTQTINTNTDDYQLVFGAADVVTGLVNMGYFTPISDLTHVNMDKVWWNRGYSESIAINKEHPTVLSEISAMELLSAPAQ